MRLALRRGEVSHSRSGWASFTCALLAVGCELGPPPVDVIPCPTVFSGSGSYVGFVGVPGDLHVGQCVELYVDGERRAFTRAGLDGAFYMTMPLGTQAFEVPIEMRIDGDRYRVYSGGPSLGQITYPEGVVPLQETDEGGRAHVRADVRPLNPIERTFTVNYWVLWPDVVVEPFDRGGTSSSPSDPPPRTMSGAWMEMGTLITEHTDGTGGCWWPQGGGEIIQCSDRQWSENRCMLESFPCTQPRGCAVIEVEERRSGIEPHDDRTIRVGVPMGLPDAGPMPDGGPSDATIM